MNSRLVLTLWLVGAVLYAGSTIFLAHAVLGGSVPADKAKVGAVATAANAQCQKDTITSAEAKSRKGCRERPAKDRRHPAEKPAPHQHQARQSRAAPETAKHDLAPQRQTPGAEQRSAEDHPSSDNQQDPDASSPDGAPGPTAGSSRTQWLQALSRDRPRKTNGLAWSPAPPICARSLQCRPSLSMHFQPAGRSA